MIRGLESSVAPELREFIHAYAEGGNPGLVLGILSLLLIGPIVLLFLPIPPAALAHRRAEGEPEREARADRLPLPKRIGATTDKPVEVL